MKQRYIKVNRDLVPVSEEVYQTASRWKERARDHARRSGSCGQNDYHRCNGDCAVCPWQQAGHRTVSLNTLLGDEHENETTFVSESQPLIDDIVSDKLMLEQLYQQLDQLIPNGARVFQMRANNYTEREIARALGIKAQSTLNYRIRKMDDYIRTHREELEDLLR